MKRITVLCVALLLTFVAADSALAWGGSAYLRIVHASPDAPAVNVLVDGRVLASHVSYGQSTRYAPLQPDSYNIKVVSADRDQIVVIDTDLVVEEGTYTTVAAVGRLAGIEPLVMEDNTDPPAWGQAKVRVVHASANAPAVDVTTAQGDLLFSAAPFKGVTDFREVERGLYHLQVKPAGAQDVVLEIPWLPLQPGSATTVMVMGLVNEQPELSYLIFRGPRFSAGSQPCNGCWRPMPPNPCCGSGYYPPRPPAYWPSRPNHPQNYPNPQFGDLRYRYYYHGFGW